ncbi:deoxyribodipyrimidine photo-lyase, partial [Leclercia sp. M50]
MATHLVWFRADLRIHDNLALAAACRDKHARVLALFIATPQQWREHAMAPRQAAFLHAHLNDLQQQLADRNIPLLYAQVADFAAQGEKVAQLCAEHEVTHLFYNYQYELNEQQRDRQLERALQEVICQGFDDSVILPPGSVMTGSHEMYKVFTPFKNAWLRRLKEGLPECAAAPAVREGEKVTPAALDFDYPQQPFDTDLFPASEREAIARLRQFCQQGAGEYEAQRDFPAIEGTSRLSACLALGVLSPRQCLHRLLAEQPEALEGGPGAVW